MLKREVRFFHSSVNQNIRHVQNKISPMLSRASDYTRMYRAPARPLSLIAYQRQASAPSFFSLCNYRVSEDDFPNSCQQMFNIEQWYESSRMLYGFISDIVLMLRPSQFNMHRLAYKAEVDAKIKADHLQSMHLLSFIYTMTLSEILCLGLCVWLINRGPDMRLVDDPSLAGTGRKKVLYRDQNPSIKP